MTVSSVYEVRPHIVFFVPISVRTMEVVLQGLKLGHSIGSYKDTGGNMGKIQRAGEQRYRNIAAQGDGTGRKRW